MRAIPQKNQLKPIIFFKIALNVHFHQKTQQTVLLLTFNRCNRFTLIDSNVMLNDNRVEYLKSYNNLVYEITSLSILHLSSR